MDYNPLVTCMLSTEDEVENGFIFALINACEEGSKWPWRGMDLLSPRAWSALGEVVTLSKQVAPLLLPEVQKSPRTVVAESLKVVARPPLKKVKRVTRDEMRRRYGVGAKIYDPESPTNNESSSEKIKP